MSETTPGVPVEPSRHLTLPCAEHVQDLHCKGSSVSTAAAAAAAAVDSVAAAAVDLQRQPLALRLLAKAPASCSRILDRYACYP
jgi:hypothetical protein